jgi:hypothetical protein
MKKLLALVVLIAVVGAVMTIMRRGDDDEFLDEELA